jgi:putative acetyltransferase
MASIIRSAEPSDYEAISHIYSMPKVILGTLQIPYQSTEIWRKRLSEPPDDQYNLVAFEGTEVVGHLGIQTFIKSHRRRHIGQIVMAVHDDWQGKGIGTSLMQSAVELSDKWLNLIRIELEVYVDNEPAIKLYKKFNFAIEGIGKKFAYRNGEYSDVYLMARVR